MRLCPSASATLIACTGVAGSATKNRLNGMVVPLPYVGPTESCCTAGRNTPLAVRYGGARGSGGGAEVVVVPRGELRPGGPAGPTENPVPNRGGHLPHV